VLSAGVKQSRHLMNGPECMPPCIDGAGELRLDLFCGHRPPYPAFSVSLSSIFSHGGCQSREKVVASSAKKFDIISEFKRDWPSLGKAVVVVEGCAH
jgi:hypothetical protein